MAATTSQAPFPCPFCHSTRVVLIGGGLVFLHYQCAECAEVWTAMGQPTVTYPARRTTADPVQPELAAPFTDSKFWRN